MVYNDIRAIVEVYTVGLELYLSTIYVISSLADLIVLKLPC